MQLRPGIIASLSTSDLCLPSTARHRNVVCYYRICQLGTVIVLFCGALCLVGTGLLIQRWLSLLILGSWGFLCVSSSISRNLVLSLPYQSQLPVLRERDGLLSDRI